ncbi:MAG TPA: hypothetical protein VMF69_03215 [Gemmataceae bacterium]|nr:hypothetical protein [Gemmataceae bacterium]
MRPPPLASDVLLCRSSIREAEPNGIGGNAVVAATAGYQLIMAALVRLFGIEVRFEELQAAVSVVLDHLEDYRDELTTALRKNSRKWQDSKDG